VDSIDVQEAHVTEHALRYPKHNVLSIAAVTLAAGAVLAYSLAVAVDDGYYLFCGVLGIAAFFSGRKARRSTDWAAARAITLLATIVGGLAGAAVIVCTVVWGLSYVV